VLQLLSRTLVLMVLALASAAWAHDADVVYVLVRTPAADAPGALLETVTLTAPTLGLLAPVDADADGLLTQPELDARATALRAGVWDDMPLSAGNSPCVRSDERAWLREGFVELEARFACGPGELRQDFRFLRVLPTNYRVVLGSQLDGERNRTFAQGSFTSLVVPRPGPNRWWSLEQLSRGLAEGVARAFWLGVLGAFALGLSLATWRRLAWSLALLVVALAPASLVAVPEWLPALTVALTSLGLALARRDAHPAFAVLVGAAIGALNGHPDVSRAVGLAAGSLMVLLPVLVVGVAVARIAGRRGRLAQARWVAAAVCAAASALALARR
jgi:hypothetical protein